MEEKLEKRERNRTTLAIIVIALLAVLSGVLAALYVTAKAGKSEADERYRALAEGTVNLLVAPSSPSILYTSA